MPNKTSYGLKKQLNSPNLKRRTMCMLHKTHVILTHMEMKVGPSQRIEICSNLCQKNIKND
jgi:hypothetical protein